MEPRRIVSMDPWGHLVAETFQSEIAGGLDLRPSIAVTRARLDLPEIRVALPAPHLVQTDRGDVSRVGDAPRYASLSASNRGNDSLSLWRGRETGRPADTSHLPCA